MILVLLLLGVHSCASFDVRRHLSTKTPYALRQRFGNLQKGSRELDKTVFLTGVIRHGTRWPTNKTIVRYNELKPFKKSVFSWETAISQAGELHKIGQFEMHALAQRLKNSFPTLFSFPYSTDNYLFTSTGKSRTSASAVAFGMGAFPELCETPSECLPQAIGLRQNSLQSDTLLRFFDIDENYRSFRKQTKYNLSTEFSKTLYKVIADRNPKLESFIKDVKQIGSLWEVCQMEASLLDGDELRFCQLFEEPEIELLEWSSDFEKFLRSGNGNPINCCLAMPLLDHLITSLEDAQQERLQEGKLARLYFAHAETLLPLACLLGLDTMESRSKTLVNLLSQLGSNTTILDNSEVVKKHSEAEIWKCGLLSPMGGNLILTLHLDPSNKTHYVRLYWNEELLDGSWCAGKNECTIDEFKENVYESISQYGSCTCTSSISASCTSSWNTPSFNSQTNAI